MQIDISNFLDTFWARVLDSGDEFINQFRDDQRPVIENCVRRAGEITAMMLADPANISQYEQDLKHILNTLQSEVAVTSFRADQNLRYMLAKFIRETLSFLLIAI